MSSNQDNQVVGSQINKLTNSHTMNFISDEDTTSRASGYYTEETLTQFYKAKLRFESCLVVSKRIYILLFALAVVSLVLGISLLKFPQHCIYSCALCFV